MNTRKSTVRNFLLILFSAWAMVFFSVPVASQYIIKEDERPFIPEWCDYTQWGRKKDYRTNHPQHIEFLMNKVGKRNWESFHHYCMALVNIYRSHQVNLDENHRRHELNEAIGGIDYVIRNSSKDLIIIPELLTKKGYALLRLGNYYDAERVLLEAVSEGKIKEPYWPAYGYLSDVYLAQGKRDMAKTILQEGLKVAPNAKGLKNRLSAIK